MELAKERTIKSYMYRYITVFLTACTQRCWPICQQSFFLESLFFDSWSSVIGLITFPFA